MKSSGPADLSKQNTSSAVMQQRIEPHDSLDDFPTPPWATRALMAHIINPLSLDMRYVMEPACGRGYMAEVLTEHFQMVQATDIFDYGYGGVMDFLLPFDLEYGRPDWVVTNPPFRLAAQFIEKALEITTVGVAIFARTAFLEGVERYRTLFKPCPPSLVATFVERVPLLKGRVAEYVIDKKTGKRKKASTATNYCWIIWRRDARHTKFLWIPPCRRQLERGSDYAGPPNHIKPHLA